MVNASSPVPSMADRPEPAFEDWMSAILERTEAALAQHLPPADTSPATLHEAMRYATLGGGKRIRALLCHAAGAVTGAAPDALDAAACALEMVHAYSLVHDDLPAMDDDMLRRGQPTVHIRYGEAAAILVGDALQARAYAILTDAPLPPEQRLALLRELAVASGSQGMVGGQAIDLASVGKTLPYAELEQMHRMKTGALLRAAVSMGAHCGDNFDAVIQHALEDYQGAIGLAFQVVDDILDTTADTATLGKTAGKDAQAGKPTYVSAIGLDASLLLARQLGENAHQALAPLGPNASRLHALADLVINRIY